MRSSNHSLFCAIKRCLEAREKWSDALYTSIGLLHPIRQLELRIQKRRGLDYDGLDEGLGQAALVISGSDIDGIVVEERQERARETAGYAGPGDVAVPHLG